MSAFLIDDPELSVLGVDLAWPLAIDATGDLATVERYDALIQSVTLAAVTTPGEIAHKPDEGVPWQEYQNGPADPAEFAALRARLLQQYATHEPRLIAVDVDVQSDPAQPDDILAVVHGVAKTGVQLDVPVPLTVA